MRISPRGLFDLVSLTSYSTCPSSLRKVRDSNGFTLYGAVVTTEKIDAAERIYSPPCTRASLRAAARGAPNRASYHASDSARPERTSCVGA